MYKRSQLKTNVIWLLIIGSMCLLLGVVIAKTVTKNISEFNRAGEQSGSKEGIKNSCKDRYRVGYNQTYSQITTSSTKVLRDDTWGIYDHQTTLDFNTNNFAISNSATTNNQANQAQFQISCGSEVKGINWQIQISEAKKITSSQVPFVAVESKKRITAAYQDSVFNNRHYLLFENGLVIRIQYQNKPYLENFYKPYIFIVY